MSGMRLKYRIPLAIIVILLVITLFVGSSYALWKVTVYQEGVNVINAGCFELEFIEQSSSINLNNAYPISDEKGLKTTPYIFKLKNNCTIDAKYTLYLNTLEVTGTKISDNFIKYAITKETDVLVTANNLSTATINPSIANFTYDKNLITSYEISTGTLKGRSSSTVDDGEEITYSLRLWIDESATKEIGGETFEAAITSVAYATRLE